MLASPDLQAKGSVWGFGRVAGVHAAEDDRGNVHSATRSGTTRAKSPAPRILIVAPNT